MGKFGIFGVDKQEVHNNVMNWIAIWLVVLAMGVFFFIKPTLERETYQSITASGDIQKVDEINEESIYDRIPTQYKGIIGVGLAVLSGVLYGVNMVPMTLWVQDQQKVGDKPGPLDFVFSHFTGIFLYSTAVFVVYCLVNRPPKVYPAAILPSMISGAMWGIAQCGLMSATQILGYAVGFPIGSAGPLLVSSTWSVLYFREIRGQRNIGLLLGSFSLLLTGIVLLALSDT